MNNTEFQKVIAQTFESMQKLTATKGEEYAEGKTGSNQLQNFDRQAAELSIPPEKVLLVLLGKHMVSIQGWANGRKMSEPIEGRIDDAILYLLLLKGMVTRRHREPVPAPGGVNYDAPLDPLPVKRGY
jgi:hypothetical protein